jgi:MFS family permease
VEAAVIGVAAAARRAFSSLRIRNYRLYFTGQVVSVSGTWMQGVAQAWLVLNLTGSGTALGLVSSLQFLPVLFLGPLGGMITDRFDKRRLLLITQTAAALLATTLGLLVLFDLARLWMVFALAAGLGFVNLVDNPTRQTFVIEMVGPQDLVNAVGLNSVIFNLARMIGPAIAGILIVTVGLAPCFLINAASYLAVIAALTMMRVSELHRAPLQPRGRGQLRDGFRYVRSTPALLIPLLMMGVMGTLAYEFQVILPLVARFTFGGDAATYGTLMAVFGAGAVMGGLLTAIRRRRGPVSLSRTALVFGTFQVAAALAPTLWAEIAILVFVGAASITFVTLSNSTLQLASAPEMRGRVMGLYAVAFLGSVPIGAPIIGWIGGHLGPRYGLGLGGLVSLACGALAYRSLVKVAAVSRPYPAEQSGRPQAEPA